VVGTEVGGIPTAVDAGETGYLVPKDGISELAGRMEELLGIRVSTNGWLKRLGRGPSSTIDGDRGAGESGVCGESVGGERLCQLPVVVDFVVARGVDRVRFGVRRQGLVREKMKPRCPCVFTPVTVSGSERYVYSPGPVEPSIPVN